MSIATPDRIPGHIGTSKAGVKAARRGVSDVTYTMCPGHRRVVAPL
jgi:hypothetical protein